MVLTKKNAFVHVNYNNSLLTIDCVRSILTNCNQADIIIVDNDSNQSEKDLLVNYIDSQNTNQIKCIFENRNLGYFGALNVGIGQIINSANEYDFVIIGNNDLEFQADFFDRLSKIKVQDDIFVLAPNIIKPNGIHQNPYCIDRVSKTRKFLYRIIYSSYSVAQFVFWLTNILKVAKSEMSRSGHEVSQYIYAGHGSCYILTSGFFKYNKLLVNLTFLMGEEFVLANQVKNTHGKIYYDADLRVLHNEHSSMGKIPSKKVYEFNRNAYNIVKNYF